MDRIHHFYMYLPVMLILIYVYRSILPFFMFFLANPDMDLMLSKHHRHIITHSLLFTALIIYAMPMIPPLMVVAPISTHLLADLTAHGKRVGTWRLWFFYKRLSTKTSIFVLIISALGGFIFG